jgi:hypothetical protein
MRFKRLVQRIGHRGAFLAFLALLDILYGYSILAEPGLVGNYDLGLTVQSWGLVWLATGIVLLTGIATRHDRVHFGLAAALKAAWAMIWFKLWLFEHTPRGWVPVVIWAAFAAVVVVVSSWPEMRKLDSITGDRNGDRE